MSVLDMVKSKVKEYTDPNGPGADMLNSAKKKVKEYTDPDGPGVEMLNTAKTKVSHGLDGAGRYVDEKTNGKYSDTIHSGVGKAREFLGDKPKDGPEGSAEAAEAQTPGDTSAEPTDSAQSDSAQSGGPEPRSDGSSPPHSPHP